MDYQSRAIIIFLIFIQSLVRTSCQYDKGSAIYMEEAKSIFKTIFPTYNRNVPPRKDFPAPIMLDLTADVVHVSDLDPIRHVLTSTVDVTVMWKDTRLAWNSQNVKEITVNKTLVWRPEISIVNAVGRMVEVETPDLVLKGSGEIKWVRRLQMQTLCPHDQDNMTVSCDIVFGAGVHLEYKLADFGNVTEQTCTTSIPSSNMWDISLEGSKLEDQQIGNVTIEADPEITCTVMIKKKPGCCKQSQTASQNSDSSNGQHSGSSRLLFEFLFVVSTVIFCIFAQL